ncbi:hypothetical protein CS8_101250 [Cupriavidus sp. 8B]
MWIRVQMVRHGLTLTNLQAPGCFSLVAPPPAAPEPMRTYRNAEGQKWGWAGRDAGPHGYA